MAAKSKHQGSYILGENLKKRLEYYAKNQLTNSSHIVRVALTEYLNKNEK